MNGEQHFAIGVLSSVLLAAPWLPALDPISVLILFLAAFIGSLAPDADTPEAAIMRGLRKGPGIAGSLRRHSIILLPPVGYVIRYLVYYPVSAVLWVFSLGRLRPRHRGFLHSMIGIIIATLLLSFYIAAVLLWFGIALPTAFYAFAGGFFAGSFFHLAADSCTKSGICWWYPFSKHKIRGDIITGDEDERRPLILCALLLASIGISMVAAAMYWPAKPEVLALPPALLVLIWLGFMCLAGVHRT